MKRIRRVSVALVIIVAYMPLFLLRPQQRRARLAAFVFRLLKRSCIRPQRQIFALDEYNICLAKLSYAMRAHLIRQGFVANLASKEICFEEN